MSATSIYTLSAAPNTISAPPLEASPAAGPPEVETAVVGVDPPSDTGVERPTIGDESTVSGAGKDFWAWVTSKLDNVKAWLTGKLDEGSEDA